MNFSDRQKRLMASAGIPLRSSALLMTASFGGGDAPPDPNQAAVAGMQADMANFPQEWMVNALSQMGGKATIGGKTYDFTGLGNNDTNAKISDQMAQTLLDIQNNYGAAYIQQRLKDLQQADPTGYAARKQLFDKIMADAEANPNRPMAEELQKQVNGVLQNAGQLDEQGKQQVQQGVRGQQVAKGIYLGNAPASEEAGAVVGAADNLRAQQQLAASNYLNAGISPEDVTYRRIQQGLSNLGAFVNGQTPTAQFGQLSGAQNQAAPFNPVNYSNPASLNLQQGAQTGINFANQSYQNNQNQANPWMAAGSFLTQGLNSGANAYKAYNNYQSIYGAQPNYQAPVPNSPLASGYTNNPSFNAGMIANQGGMFGGG